MFISLGIWLLWIYSTCKHSFLHKSNFTLWIPRFLKFLKKINTLFNSKKQIQDEEWILLLLSMTSSWRHWRQFIIYHTGSYLSVSFFYTYFYRKKNIGSGGNRTPQWGHVTWTCHSNYTLMLEVMSTVLCKLGGFIWGSFKVKDGKASESYPPVPGSPKSSVWIGLKLASKVNLHPK